MFREKKNVLMALSMSFIPFFAFAEDEGYVELMADASYKEGNGFAKATWSKVVADPSAADYLVTKGKTFSTAYKEDSVPARSITFGEVGGGEGFYRAYYSVTYEGSGGLVFANGKCWSHLAKTIINGDLTVTSPEEVPFSICSDGYRGGLLQFTGALKSNAECGIIVYSGFYSKSEGNNPFTLKFTGDVSGYLGSVIVTSQYDSVGAVVPMTFNLSGDAKCFGGSMTYGYGAVFQPQVSTSVGSLMLKSGAKLDLPSGAGLEVREDFTIETGVTIDMYVGSTLTVGTELNLPESPLMINLNGASLSAVSEVVRYALINLPIESSLTADDFDIANKGTVVAAQPFLSMVPNEDGKTKTLYVTYCPVITLTKDEESVLSQGNSSVYDGEYWDDGRPVHGDAIYKIPKIQGTTYFSLPYVENAPYVFPAQALVFGAYTTLYLRSDDNVVSNVFFNGGADGADVRGPASDRDLTLRSRFSISGVLNFSLRNNVTLRLVGPIKGTESSIITVQSLSGSTSACRGWTELNGDNTGYMGKIKVTSNYPQNVSYGNFASLIVTSASNLGGPRSSFTYDALSLDRYGQLDVRESIVLDEPTRGIFVSWIGRILVAEEKELAIKQQLTVNGRFYKEGAGTLALGGDLRFLDAEGTVTEEIPKDATNRTFYVTGGKVKPLAAHALDGLDVVFSNKTSKLDVGLALDLNTTDEELRTKGICNVKSSAPFAFLDDDAQKKIPLYLEWDNIPQADEYSFNVMTVNADCADALNKLKIVVPQSLAHLKLTTTRSVDTEAGTVTLSAKLKKYGFAISIR